MREASLLSLSLKGRFKKLNPGNNYEQRDENDIDENEKW